MDIKQEAVREVVTNYYCDATTRCPDLCQPVDDFTLGLIARLSPFVRLVVEGELPELSDEEIIKLIVRWQKENVLPNAPRRPDVADLVKLVAQVYRDKLAGYSKTCQIGEEK